MQRTPGGWKRRGFVGNAFVTVGALTSAFGAVGWLSALRFPSTLMLMLAFVGYGLLPLAGGILLVWRGLDLIDEADGERRALSLSRVTLLEALEGGATARQVADKLRMPNAEDAERALDALVRDDLVRLDVTDEGELVYRCAENRPR